MRQHRGLSYNNGGRSPPPPPALQQFKSTMLCIVDFYIDNFMSLYIYVSKELIRRPLNSTNSYSSFYNIAISLRGYGGVPQDGIELEVPRSHVDPPTLTTH